VNAALHTSSLPKADEGVGADAEQLQLAILPGRQVLSQCLIRFLVEEAGPPALRLPILSF